MSRRAVVLILAGVIAAAVAIPALADPGPTAKSASVKGLSKRALAKAKKSLRVARRAQRVARRATSAARDAATDARAAQGTAGAAATAADAARGFAAGALRAANAANERAGDADAAAREARSEAAASRVRAGFAAGTVATGSTSFVAFSGGPAVSVDVPASGLVQVWAQAVIDGAGAADGVVSLYEDGRQVEGQADCGVEGVLFSGTSLEGEPELVGTPAVPNLTGGCGSLGAPGPVLFSSSAGRHTFELRYASCSCGESPANVSFSQRRLVVQPLP